MEAGNDCGLAVLQMVRFYLIHEMRTADMKGKEAGSDDAVGADFCYFDIPFIHKHGQFRMGIVRVKPLASLNG